MDSQTSSLDTSVPSSSRQRGRKRQSTLPKPAAKKQLTDSSNKFYNPLTSTSSAPTDSKRSSPKKQKIFEEVKIHFNLGRDKFVSHSKFKDADYLHLRVFENGIPQKKGIALCPERARSLLDIVHVIDQEAENNWTTTPGGELEYFQHLGYGTYIRAIVSNKKRFYDVRRYWKPENNTVIPTKQGLYMNADEFGELQKLSLLIIESVPAIRDAISCTCWFNPDATLSCPRCYPFPINYGVSNLSG